MLYKDTYVYLTGADFVFCIHLLFWVSQCICPQLYLVVNYPRTCRLWYWRSSTVV